MARTALHDGGDRLILLLSVNNADKAPKPASFPVRLAMMEAFAREILRDVDVEVDLAVTTMPYFPDKAVAMSESGFHQQQTFIAGFDTLVRILDPKYYGGVDKMNETLQPFFNMARVRAVTRPDDKWGGTREQKGYVDGLDERWKGRVDVIEGGEEEVGVSSSRVRDAVRSGDEQDGLVCGEVREWIDREKLYSE